MKIGVFDSGSGGITTLRAIRQLLPEAEMFYIGDEEYHPYGTKSAEELIEITTGVVKRLVDWGATLVVIACNTATTCCIRALRERFPDVTFVGTEPAVKPAVEAGCGKILLLATEATSRSEQVRRLTAGRPEVTILPCPGLAEAVEKEVGIDELILEPGLKVPEVRLNDTSEIRVRLEKCLPAERDFDGVVLGCTHYVLAKDIVREYFPNAQMFDGNEGVARRVLSMV